MVSAILPDSQDGIWVGTAGGLATTGGGLTYFDGAVWTIYNIDNSELPDNDVLELAKNAQGKLWIGTYGGGLAKLDGNNWTVYNTSNSDLPSNSVFGLAFDAQGNLWIGTFGGLAMFNGKDWTVYNKSNSDLPNNLIYDISIDSKGALWIGTANHNSGPTAGGLVKFDGKNWTVYNTSNSDLPHNDVYSVKIDKQDNVWVGTGDHIPSSVGGLAKFDGIHWDVYKKSNSNIPFNLVYTLTIDTEGNKWIGSVNFDEPGGLAVLRESSTTIDKKEGVINNKPLIFSLAQNYPNPFNPTTLINYQLPITGEVKLSVYNLLGQKMITLVSEKQPAGTYRIEWNAKDLLSGVYLLELVIDGHYRLVKRMVLQK